MASLKEMVVGILQARTSSTRLPSKVLMPILGQPMLARQIERIRRASQIDRLVVATSCDKSDDPIEALCSEIGCDCYRGNLTDVVDRYYRAAIAHGARIVVRLTGDCPLTDPKVIDSVIETFKTREMDYVSNTIVPSFPDGLDVEVFSMEALEDAWRVARGPGQREHVTPFVYGNPQRYRLHNVMNGADLSKLRWTVDRLEDFVFVTRVYEALYPVNAAFSTEDILALLSQKPELNSINAHLLRNEGFASSTHIDRALEEKRH